MSLVIDRNDQTLLENNQSSFKVKIEHKMKDDPLSSSLSRCKVPGRQKCRTFKSVTNSERWSIVFKELFVRIKPLKIRDA